MIPNRRPIPSRHLLDIHRGACGIWFHAGPDHAVVPLDYSEMGYPDPTIRDESREESLASSWSYTILGVRGTVSPTLCAAIRPRLRLQTHPQVQLQALLQLQVPWPQSWVQLPCS